MNGGELMDDQVKTLQHQPRWPWFAAGALLIGSAAFAAASVHLLWTPCQSIMRAGILAADGDGPTEECFRRMDTSFPFVGIPEAAGFAPSALAAVAGMLAAASWIVLILGLQLSAVTKRIALIAAAAPMALSVSIVLAPGVEISAWLWMAFDVVAVVVFLLLVGRNRELGGTLFLGLALVLWGANPFGVTHLFSDYMVTAGVNAYNWDTPPGTGYLTVASLVVAGCLAVGFGLLRRNCAPGKPESRPTRCAQAHLP